MDLFFVAPDRPRLEPNISRCEARGTCYFIRAEDQNLGTTEEPSETATVGLDNLGNHKWSYGVLIGKSMGKSINVESFNGNT